MMGNLTRDPDYKQLASGQAICRLGLASNRQFKNRSTGSLVQEVCFVDVDVWGPTADTCNQFLQKGRLVLVEGRLKLDTWEDAEGNRRSKHLIVADRVTFLPAGMSQSDDVSSSVTGAKSFGNNNSQASAPVTSGAPSDSGAEEAPAKKAKKKAAKKASDSDSASAKTGDSGEIDFKDEKPFEDELPF